MFDMFLLSNFSTSLTYKLLNFENNAYYMLFNLDPFMYNEISTRVNYNSIFMGLNQIYDENKNHFF